MKNIFVSYPKSGRTWIRYALVSMNKDAEIKFSHDMFEFNNGKKPKHNFDIARRRVFYRDLNVIYLERDPRDVMVSLYNQVTGRFMDFFDYQGDISDFLRDDYFGAHNLMQFRSMWNELCEEGCATRITYEECHENFSDVLSRVCKAFKMSVESTEIEKATEASSIENMRKVEDSGSFPQPWLRKRNSHSKVRRGKKGGYKDVLSQNDIEYLNSVFF